MKIRLMLLLWLTAFGLVACAVPREQPPATTAGGSPPAEKEVFTPGPQPGPKKLLIIGEAEYITIKPGNIHLKARVDTGATTSSIHATDIKLFERNGKKWVRFNLVRASGEKFALERPVVRTIEVKRHGMKQQSRPVVTLHLVMGPIAKTTEFSLTDRSQYKFPVLIGRSFLKGVAMVDVNRDYVLSPLGGDRNEK